MPNFHTKLLSPIKCPHEEGGVLFKWIAKDKKNKNDILIYTISNGEEFFLKQIKKKKKILVKGDKLSKPSTVKVLQNALQMYEKATKSSPIYTNINSRKNRIEQENVILKDIDFFAQEFIKYSEKFENIHIDVGFGSGRHLLFKAEQNPKDLYIGIEIYKPSIEQVIKLCKIKGLKNLIVIDFDARVLMEFFPSNLLSTIYIHFPVPWEKKPHRRVINDEFLHQAVRVLKKGGRLELRTDSEEYFAYSFEIFKKLNYFDMEVRKNMDLEISSKYEDRWKKMQKNIYDLILINQHHSEAFTKPVPLRFDIVANGKNFKKETIVEDNYFVHFQVCYEIDNDSYVWKLAFGDSACVQNCYIIIKDSKARYFPRNIYSTKQNINAHEKILERLHQ